MLSPSASSASVIRNNSATSVPAPMQAAPDAVSDDSSVPPRPVLRRQTNAPVGWNLGADTFANNRPITLADPAQKIRLTAQIAQLEREKTELQFYKNRNHDRMVQNGTHSAMAVAGAVLSSVFLAVPILGELVVGGFAAYAIWTGALAGYYAFSYWQNARQLDNLETQLLNLRFEYTGLEIEEAQRAALNSPFAL